MRPINPTAIRANPSLSVVQPRPILVIESLSKRFGEVAVLRGVTASVNRGEITAFVGPNGAGKTTLFHAISGDIRADGGAVVMNGVSLENKAPWQVARLGMGKLFQDVRIFPNLSVLENVLLAVYPARERSLAATAIRAVGRTRRIHEAEVRAQSCLALAGVEEPWDRPAGSLSFGNQKLLALARLVAGDFRLLLLDEPTSGVSLAMIEKISEILQALVREHGVSVALIEHNFTFVREVAAKTFLLHGGEIMDSGETREVLDKSENREVLIGL